MRAGTYTESDIPGGPTQMYTITAKSGNVITLDRMVETDYLTPDMHVYKMNRSITVKGTDYLPAGPYFSDNSSAVSKVEISNINALMLGSRNAEQIYLYRQAFGPRYAVSNCAFYYIEVDHIYTRPAMEWKNNVVVNSSSTNFSGNSTFNDNIVHGNFLGSTSGTRFRSQGDLNIYTGNFYDSYRYAYLQSTYKDVPTPARLEVKGNFWRFEDYMNVDWGTYHGLNTLNIEMYSNKTSGRGGYYRPYPQAMSPWTTSNRVEWPENFDTFTPFAGQIRTNSHIPVYRTPGTDRLELLPVYGHPDLSGRDYLIDDGRKIIVKKSTSNEYDIYAIHLNRVGAVVLGASFITTQQQTLKLVSTLDYYTPESIDDYNYGSSPGRDFRYVLIGPDGKLITGYAIPYQTEYGKQTFEHTFTAPAGSYHLAIIKRHGGYGHKIMTYRDASFTLLGSSPETVHMGSNNFADHMLLSDPTKMVAGQINPMGKDVLKQTGQRTTVKFRKIKF